MGRVLEAVVFSCAQWPRALTSVCTGVLLICPNPVLRKDACKAHLGSGHVVGPQSAGELKQAHRWVSGAGLLGLLGQGCVLAPRPKQNKTKQNNRHRGRGPGTSKTHIPGATQVVPWFGNQDETTKPQANPASYGK